MKIINFLPFSLAAFYFLLFELLVSAPTSYYKVIVNFGFNYALIFTLLLLIISVCNLLTAKLLVPKELGWRFLNFALLPATVSWSVLWYVVILQSPCLIQLIALALTVFIYLYWRLVFFYFYNHKLYTAFSLENLSFYANFLSYFIFGAASLGLRMLLAVDWWLILLMVVVFVLLVMYQQWWISKYNKSFWWLLFAGGLSLIQVFAALMFLPHDHQILGFLWATIYYLVMTVIGEYAKKGLDLFKIKAYLIIVGISWLLLLATAAWL